MNLKRRDFIHVGLFGLANMNLIDLARADETRISRRSADAVLFFNLAGGPSHLDTLDMKPDGPSDTRGEFNPIQSKIPGVVVCEHMPKIAAGVDQLSLVRGISHTVGDHPQGQAYIATGNRPGPALKHPSCGSIVSNEIEISPDLPPYIAIPSTEWNAGFMGDSFAPFKTNAVPVPGKPFTVRGISLPEGITLEKVERRQKLLQKVDRAFRDFDTNSELLEALDTFGQRAHRMMTSQRTRQAFDVSREPESIRNLFGKDPLGQSALLATRLVSSGIPFVTVTNTGWDTHLDNFAGHKRLIPPFDAALMSTITALREKGLLERTLVVAMGEFGRTPKINPNVGRDHYPRVNWSVMAGGGVQPGRLLGASDASGEQPTDDTDISPDDIVATLLSALGIDPRKEYYTRTGRPVSLVPHGEFLSALF